MGGQATLGNYLLIIKEACDYLGIECNFVEWKTLGELTEYSKDKIDAEELNENNYVGVENLLKDKRGKEKSNYVPENGKLIRYNEKSILLGNIRPYLRKIWFSNIIGGTNGDVLVFNILDFKRIIPEYLYYILSSEQFFEYNIKYSRGAKMPRGDKTRIMLFEFPVPPLFVQEYVVDILDKFDTLVNDIKNGLPREIELRQREYEFYREKLLIFDRESLGL